MVGSLNVVIDNTLLLTKITLKLIKVALTHKDRWKRKQSQMREQKMCEKVECGN